MNIWLCKNSPENTAKYPWIAADENIIAHGTSLGSLVVDQGSIYKSALSNLASSDLDKYSKFKKNWDLECLEESKSRIAEACKESRRLSAVQAGGIERLFSHCTRGCFDSLAFLYSMQANPGKPCQVLIGGDYRLTEIFGLIWWMSLVNYYSEVSGQQCSFVELRDLNKNLKFREIAGVIEGWSKPPKKLSFDDVEGGGESALFWVGSVRFPGSWDRKIADILQADVPIIRFCEIGRRHHHCPPCVELEVDRSFSASDVKSILEETSEIMKTHISNNSDLGNFLFESKRAIYQYVEKIVAPRVVDRIADLTDVLSENLKTSSVKGVFASVAPFVEAMALIEFGLRKGVKSVLLPHSWTSCHDYDPTLYGQALTFIDSKDIMPSLEYRLGTAEKESLISFEEMSKVSSQNPVNRSSKLKFLINLLFVLLNKRPSMWKVFDWIRKKNADKKRQVEFAAKINQADINIGIILNYEQYEYTAGLDFHRLFLFLRSFLRKFSGFSGPKIHIAFRRKKNWTNLDMLSGILFDSENFESSVSPDSISLKEFGANCDLILFIQGTTAICELMKWGIPCIRIDCTGELVLVERDYIKFSDTLVPNFGYSALESFLLDADFKKKLAGLAKRQQDWMDSKLF